MEILIFAVILLLSLLMIPFGMPGTLVMVAAAIGYKLLVPGSLGWFTVGAVTALMILGEVLEWTLAARYTRKYGGSRRASWGAILGGMIGAFVGVPVPIVGPVLGAFAGAFIGAFVGEISREWKGGAATKVATGALIGRVVAAGMKISLGVVMAVWLLAAAWI